MIPYLKRPYKLDANPGKEVRNAFFFGLFVFVFLYVFKPFNIGTYPGNLVQFTAGYGLVTILVMLLLNVGIEPLLPKFFDEQKWTTGREILWTLINIGFIALGNVLYTAALGVMHFSLLSISSILLYTLAIGLFPVTGGILFNENSKRSKFTAASDDINRALHSKHEQPHAKTVNPGSAEIIIPSENANESFAIRPENLLFMKAAENYTEVFTLKTNKAMRTIVRANLKQMENELRDHPQFLRCHKSYLVNLGLVGSISGNAQGFKLHLPFVEESIPVSRKLNTEIKQLLETYA